MGSNARSSIVGSFSGNIFDNGRIRIEIGEEYDMEIPQISDEGDISDNAYL